MRGYHLTLAVILSVIGVGQMKSLKTEEFDFAEEMKRLQDFDEDEYPNFDEEKYPNIDEEKYPNFDEEKYPKYLQDEEEYPNFDDG